VTPPSILQVVASTDRRGAEIFAVELGARLATKGHVVETVALAPGGVGGVAVSALGPRPLSVRTLMALRRKARAFDVVVAHGSRTLPACALALMKTTTPFVYRNIGDPGYWSARPLRRARVRLALRRARAVVAISNDARDVFAREYGIPRDRIAVIGRAAESSAFSPADVATRETARAALVLPSEAPVLAFVGALSPEKNVGAAIGAIPEVSGCRLVVCGGGSERESLEALADETAPGRVTFLGALDDPRTVYAAADALVLTSRTEGLPAVAIEAGLSGLPVVSTDAGFVREIVVDGVTGVIVPHDDRAALVSGIRAVLEGRVEMGAAARGRCEELFSLTKAADDWAAVLRRVR
jgi:glycosyltransferase involved in cell wall biosynthesis